MGSGGSKHKHTRTLQSSERPSPPGKPYHVPGSPKSDPDVITVRWEPPIYSGGSRIIGYLVEHKRTCSPHWVKATPVLVRHTQLSLSGLEPGMRYQFRVSAENAGGRSDPSPLSEPLAISSHQRGVAIPPVFVRSLADTTAIENEKVEFVVKVEGTPFPRISWYKDGFEVFSNRRQRVATDGEISTFIIHQTALSDEGEIKCCATNKAGHAVAKARLTLQAPPSIRLPRQYEEGLLFELGEAVRLKVSVSGRPHPSLAWFHNGRQLQPGAHRVEVAVTDRHAILRVSSASREDRGEYQLRAVNTLGEDTASFLVTITDRPVPPGKVNVVMTLGRCVTLAWTIPYDDGGCKIGNYIVEYYRIGWNVWLKAATCRQLTTTIGDLIEGSEYKFRVKAENPYGISDPSEESDTIFIPDPKRGLLEPPPKGTMILLDEMPEQWLETRTPQTDSKMRKSPIETKQQRRDWLEDDSPIPSPVLLANQVLRKVKMAPKRGWSEDSQGDSPERQLPPVPPKRKQKQSASSPKREMDLPSSDERLIYKKWDKELSPQPSYNDDLHSSSEMMLVLLPHKELGTEERDDVGGMSLDEFDMESMVAPPMSLSAPELGSCEPFDIQTLRLSASSSEIMHELTLIRFNKESVEEAEAGLKRRYGIERRRSFERRSSKVKENTLMLSQERIPLEGSLLSKRKQLKLPETESVEKKDSGKKENKVDQFSERFHNLEKSFRNYTDIFEKKLMFSDDETESSETDFEEEPYHPRSMLPRNLVKTSAVLPEETSSPVVLVHKPPMVTINEEPEPLRFESPERRRREREQDVSPSWSRESSPESPARSFRRSPSRSPSPNISLRMEPFSPLTRRTPPVAPTVPKPILKVRDRSLDRLDSSSQQSLKKVRIEEPSPTLGSNSGVFVQEENDIGLEAGEVARSRRKRPSPLAADSETNVIVNHYSDIVREYGHNKKNTPKLYLSYEELKAAAERVSPEKYDTIYFNQAEQRLTEKKQIEESSTTREIHAGSSDDLKVTRRQIGTVSSKRKFYLEYILDLFLFFVACWIYFFKDVRLTIPVLILMVYRQINEIIFNYFPSWKKRK